MRWLVEHEARLSRERAVYVRLHGQNPHPAVLVKYVRRAITKGEAPGVARDAGGKLV